MPQPVPFIISPPEDFIAQNSLLLNQAKRLARAYEDNQVIEETHLQAVGTALWQALRLDDTLIKAKERAGQHPLPILIQTSDPAIQVLPWETLYHPELKKFLDRSPGFTLARQNPELQPALPEAEKTPLRILLFTSLPDSLGDNERLDVEAEQAAAQEALLENEQQGTIILEMPDDGRFETFRSSLQSFKPHLVYLSGHGTFSQEHHNHRAWGSFLFEDQWGGKRLVAEREIAECFQNSGVQLLVISACRSAKQHPDYPQNGLSQRLYRCGVPHVIGMGESIIDRAATSFAYALLKSIADRQPVDVALQTARAAIVNPSAEDTFRDVGDPRRATISSGQWWLPQMLSYDPDHQLVDWDFTPEPRRICDLKTMLGKVSIPDRFIGRRRELRRYQNRLRSDKLNSLLITGADGMGKTALAGKLINTLRRDGFAIYSFSLHPEHDWQDTLLAMELALADDDTLYKKFELIRSRGLEPRKKAEHFFRLMLEHHQGKLALVFDNLESVQQKEAPHGLIDDKLRDWISAARKITGQGLKLILTSRWRLPDWPDAAHYSLARPVYGDFLAFARMQQLSTNKKQLRRAYETLGGNFRGLEFFIRAVKGMDLGEEKIFLEKLKDAEAEIQTNMALAEVVARRSREERELLNRLQAYRTTIPLDGVTALLKSSLLPPGQQLPDTNPREILQALLNVSLVEQYHNPQMEQDEYQLSPLVRNWLQTSPTGKKPDQPLLRVAAEFLLWLWDEDINTSWQHCMATHQALKSAGLTEKMQRFVLDWIVGPLNRDGMYQHLLDEWLLPLAGAEDPLIRGEVLGQIGKQYLDLSDYDTAPDYLKKSLAIRQEIGDTAGLCATLFNMGHIHAQNKELPEALKAWGTVYGIAKKINLAQVLDALENLAEQRGMEGGLAAWERFIP